MKRILIVGPQGSGKTIIGKMIEERLSANGRSVLNLCEGRPIDDEPAGVDVVIQEIDGEDVEVLFVEPDGAAAAVRDHHPEAAVIRITGRVF